MVSLQCTSVVAWHADCFCPPSHMFARLPFRKDNGNPKTVKTSTEHVTMLFSLSFSASHYREWVVAVGVDARRTRTTFPPTCSHKSKRQRHHARPGQGPVPRALSRPKKHEVSGPQVAPEEPPLRGHQRNAPKGIHKIKLQELQFCSSLQSRWPSAACKSVKTRKCGRVWNKQSKKSDSEEALKKYENTMRQHNRTKVRCFRSAHHTHLFLYVFCLVSPSRSFIHSFSSHSVLSSLSLLVRRFSHTFLETYISTHTSLSLSFPAHEAPGPRKNGQPKRWRQPIAGHSKAWSSPACLCHPCRPMPLPLANSCSDLLRAPGFWRHLLPSHVLFFTYVLLVGSQSQTFRASRAASCGSSGVGREYCVRYRERADCRWSSLQYVMPLNGQCSRLRTAECQEDFVERFAGRRLDDGNVAPSAPVDVRLP